MSDPNPSQALQRTPLHALHVALGARMVPFAGYDMPVSYPSGILAEHRHCREAAVLFDVSHMGQLRLVGADAAAALETLVPVDIVGLAEGRQRYALFTNDAGGILDDLMVTHRADHLFLVVNAGCKAADIAHLRATIANRCAIEPMPERALLALQGPAAGRVMARLAPSLASLTFMTGAAAKIAAIDVFATRSGYTGEDGFEISVAGDKAEALARALLAEPEVAPAGLGARDTLRLEAGLCLYGHDIGTTTTPIEAALAWAIQKVRRPGGDRAGGYPGAATIARQLGHGPERKRVGLLGLERAPVREAATIVDDAGVTIGRITSGTIGPTVGKPVALGYVPTALATPGCLVHADVRGKRQPMQVTSLPFAPHRYFRG
ncbi:MAG TPA: glycine cleavage system aminomethyltransferase GcvT [Caldimonas sp.]|jgi:aminomethyltransferase